MGYAGIATTHGFRAAFALRPRPRRRAYEKDVIEASLAHAQGELDEAYHRGSYLDKRRRLMTDWASYLTASNVIPLPAVASPPYCSRHNFCIVQN